MSKSIKVKTIKTTKTEKDESMNPIHDTFTDLPRCTFYNKTSNYSKYKDTSYVVMHRYSNTNYIIALLNPDLKYTGYYNFSFDANKSKCELNLRVTKNYYKKCDLIDFLLSLTTTNSHGIELWSNDISILYQDHTAERIEKYKANKKNKYTSPFPSKKSDEEIRIQCKKENDFAIQRIKIKYERPRAYDCTFDAIVLGKEKSPICIGSARPITINAY